MIVEMKYEEIIKLRKQALEFYKKLGNVTQEEMYRDFYNTINYHPTDDMGRPIIVHNFDVLNLGLKRRKSYKNYTEDYMLPNGDIIKVGTTTSDAFVLPGTLKTFNKFKEYIVNGIHCIILEMQSSVNYRARLDGQTVVEVVLLVATTFPSMINGIEISKYSILELHYTEVSRINGLKDKHKTFLDIYLPNGGDAISIENVEIN